MITIQLSLKSPSKTYPVLIEAALLQKKCALTPFVQGRQVALITNPTVAACCLPFCTGALDGMDRAIIFVPDGEQYKTLQTAEVIFEALTKQGFDKNATLIALGGGVVGDLTGFAAACYLRGVPYLQIPTTLLAQVDASIGGKTGVNFLGKNRVGALYHPEAVLIDPCWLQTLPEREYRSGLAEVVKYALLKGDALFFEWLEKNAASILVRELPVLADLIATCCREKIRIVEQDETDQSVRRLLNLGHTFGHAIEGALSYGTWLHGEAVSVGLLMAAFVSQRLGYLDRQTPSQIEQLLTRFGLPTQLPSTLDRTLFVTLMDRDKKSVAHTAHFVLLRGVGQAFISTEVTTNHIQEALDEYLCF